MLLLRPMLTTLKPWWMSTSGLARWLFATPSETRKATATTPAKTDLSTKELIGNGKCFPADSASRSGQSVEGPVHPLIHLPSTHRKLPFFGCIILPPSAEPSCELCKEPPMVLCH